MFCENCGTKLSVGSKFCMNCGAKVATGDTVPDTAVQEAVVQETAAQETAAQETAVSADTSVIEAEPAVAGKDTSEIADMQQSAEQYEIPGEEPVRESKAQVVSEQPDRFVPPPAQQTAPQPMASQPIPAQRTAPQPIPAQAIPQQTAPQTVQPQAGASAEAPQIKPVQSAPAQNFRGPAAQNTQIPSASQNARQSDASIQSAEAGMRPEKVKPLQTWKFVGMLIITGIPLINLLMVLIWSFSGGFNKNTRSFARAVLILWIIGLVLLIITAIVNWAMIQYLWSTFSSAQSGLPPIY